MWDIVYVHRVVAAREEEREREGGGEREIQIQ